jgi:hypothetical protein
MRHGLLAGCAAAVLLVVAATGAAGQSRPTRNAPAAGARAIPVTAAGLVGRWGDNGDCAKFIVFRGDGTFLSYTGGVGRWALSGNRLEMTGTNSIAVRVERIDRSRLRITNADGSIGTSQRCAYSG